MKKILTLILVGAVIALSPGCHSTPQRVVYSTVQASDVSVEVALGAWNDYLGTHKVTAAQELTVKHAFEKYQAAALLVSDLTQTYAGLVTSHSTNAADAQLAATAATQSAAQALADLVQVIRSFGVKI